MDTQESLKIVLEFYRELGFERLPLNYSSQQSASLSVIPAKLVPAGSKQGAGIQTCPRESGELCRGIGFPFSRETLDSRLHGNDILEAGSLLITCHSSPNKEAALNALREEIGDCQRCKLSKGRTHIVFGEGNADARIMFIGEAPGREEDLQSRPFVGDAGQLLTRLVERMGFRREDVYIANIVKCRPPMNRDPQEDEISTCFPFLDRQIEIISPDVMVSLGKISAHTLLGVKGSISRFSITKIRGRFYEYKGIPVMPTFHPAYLLRNPKDKWLTWEDAQAVLKKVSQHE